MFRLLKTGMYLATLLQTAVFAQIDYPVPLSTIAQEAIRGCFGGLDCIPSYSYPKMFSAEDADYMADSEWVLGVNLDGVQKAYPLSTLWFHEIANDRINDLYYSVSYCPLTRTGLMFNAKQGDRVIEYGVSGFLFNNNLIMYDRTNTEYSFFPQMYFTGITEPRLGEQLELWPLVMCTWKAWKSLYPNTFVVNGSLRGSWYPYGDYIENHDNIIFPQEVDPRRLSKDMVFGIIDSEFRARAYPFADMAPAAAINDHFDDRPIAVFYHDESKLAVGFDRGSIEGYETLEFNLLENATIEAFAQDKQTGSVWNILGKAVEGELQGRRLRQLVKAYSGFWFAWAAYFKPIEIYSKVTDVTDNQEIADIPERFTLEQNYPNPFNPATTIRFQLANEAQTLLSIYNLQGQLIINLVNEKKPAGFHEIVWDGRNQTGDYVPSGLYLYRLEAGEFIDLKKLTLLK